jgi:hypothetical protein
MGADGDAKKGLNRESLDRNVEDQSIDRPRLTPQGRNDPEGKGRDSTNPMGPGEKQGLADKPEG